MKNFSRFLKDESGATAIEYGLLAAFLALAIAGGARLLGNSIGEFFTKIANTLNNTTVTLP